MRSFLFTLALGCCLSAGNAGAFDFTATPLSLEGVSTAAGVAALAQADQQVAGGLVQTTRAIARGGSGTTAAATGVGNLTALDASMQVPALPSIGIGLAAGNVSQRIGGGVQHLTRAAATASTGPATATATSIGNALAVTSSITVAPPVGSPM